MRTGRLAAFTMKGLGNPTSGGSARSGWPPDSAEEFPSLSGATEFPLTRVRWTICAMLFFATSINYVDRQVLGLLAPTLQHSIGWTEAQYGYIVGGFQAAYAIGLVAAGRMVDRLGCRIGFALIMGFWSLASMGHALAASALGFGIARFFLGLGEAGSFPAAIKTTAEWFPQRERSLATGIFNSGANIGAILAPALIPWITLKFGWRAAFLSTGIIGAIWIVWWLTGYHSPQEHPRVSQAELRHIQGDSAEPTERIPWKKLLAYKQTWAYSAAKFLTDPVWYFYLYWLPKFFDERYHLGLSHLGLPLIIVYNFSALGSIGGGWLSTAMNKAGMSIAGARLSAMLVCACLILPILLSGKLSSLWSAVAILSLATAAHQGWSANLFTTASDMFPRSSVGVVVGIGGMAGSAGGVLFSLGTGWVLESYHSYMPMFSVAAASYLLGLLLLRMIAPGLRRVDAAAGAGAV
jgi:MFS transporter, ACS family, hexuronate transporter